MTDAVANEPVNWTWMNSLKCGVFWALHATCLLVFVVGWSWVAVLTCIALYFVRMFGITAGYHRYFSHRSYKTSRWFQFVMAWIGCSSAQKGPLWWAAHHRHHHQHSDTEDDLHSCKLSGFWWSHVGWVLSAKYADADEDNVKDLAKFPELRFLDRYHLLPTVLLAVATFFFGLALETWYPSLGTTGWQMLIWGFFVSTMFLYHGTFMINSVCHLFGSKRFVTGDESRNNFFFALITLGEGWHNNHHRYPGSEKQGFYWWEVDISHYVLKMLSWVGLVWDLRVPPERIYQEASANAAGH